MAFNKLLSFTKKVQDLPDQPALTPADLKAQFDAAPEEVRTYLNNLIDALTSTTSGDSGAKNVGATTVGSMTGNDVQTILGALDTRATALEATQTSLWSGSKMPLDTDTITPSKTLSQCRHGWLLLWSDFDSPSTTNDWDFHFTYIPKVFGAMFSGKNMLVPIPSYVGGTTTTNVIKSLTVFNDHIVGAALNNDGTLANNDVCLRYIFEW